MTKLSEIDAIRERYARRVALPPDRYSRLKADILAGVHERQRVTAQLFRTLGIVSLAGLDVIEVGCGNGANLLELIEFGADPRRLTGNDLLQHRLDQARDRLPASVALVAGDASGLTYNEGTFDIVLQSTVFSSILDDRLQQSLADAMWRWVRPGGGVLWYDFTYDNPANDDVRGVRLARIRELFPSARIWTRRVTLAPPIARRAMRVHRSLYALLRAIPLLRTHVLCWIQKP